jgi:phosphoglycerate dehydrogenase-like enzyme
MTPQVVDRREERDDNRLSTADLVAANGTPSTPTMAKAAQEPNLPLFAQNDTQDFRSRWEKIQIGFVDEPRKAVEQADELVASAIKRLAEVFAAERQKLEAEWDKTDNVSTEDLRVALRRYRSFFDRLLSV